jgi:acetyltransferase-like isoleucine patch superfamily enzyme
VTMTMEKPNSETRNRAQAHRHISLKAKIIGLVRNSIIGTRLFIFRRIYGMEIGERTRISLKAKLDKTNPSGVHIGNGTYIAFGAVVLAHDMSRALHFDTYIGENCHIGANAIILPGVRVGDQCIIGSGAVVSKDVPSNSVAVGNPARVVRTGIHLYEGGIIAEDYERALADSLKH